MRVLTEKEDKYKYNVWDSVEIPEEYALNAKTKIQEDHKYIEKSHKITYEPWESFYRRYSSSFFKERQWIPKEYPEIIIHTNRILEIGCGTGSTIIPLIKARIDRDNDYLQENSEHFSIEEERDSKETIGLTETEIEKCSNIYGVDYSSTAISILQSRIPSIKDQFISKDITKIKDMIYFDKKPIDSIDIILLIYTLSAIHPSEYESIFSLIHRTLKTGGVVIFKDYYEMDLTQLRFKKDQIIDKNMYKRGDDTYVYYFNKKEIESLSKDLFRIVKYKEDTKLVINRKKKKEMYRCFVEIKLEKI